MYISNLRTSRVGSLCCDLRVLRKEMLVQLPAHVLRHKHTHTVWAIERKRKIQTCALRSMAMTSARKNLLSLNVLRKFDMHVFALLHSIYSLTANTPRFSTTIHTLYLPLSTLNGAGAFFCCFARTPRFIHFDFVEKNRFLPLFVTESKLNKSTFSRSFFLLSSSSFFLSFFR